MSQLKFNPKKDKKLFKILVEVIAVREMLKGIGSRSHELKMSNPSYVTTTYNRVCLAAEQQVYDLFTKFTRSDLKEIVIQALASLPATDNPMLNGKIESLVEEAKK